MANEVLTRTPTSVGNRKKFTWAGWIKRNDIDGSGGNSYQGIFAVGTVDGSEDTFMFSSDQIRLRCESGSDITTSEQYRDPGNWMHVMMVVDTTLYDPDHRCIFYVNGVKSDVMSQENDITQNADLRINSAAKHYIGEFPRINNHLDGQIYDVFLVDGQALTPDVFGFYKDGDGYQSSGTTKATDFRPGQWMPHAPSKIKKDINRRGGFGVNGFYLPMNDSSNPGADFHTTPNSIIKLKGEDLPQPRNGAPTTSDSYVSQLRSDPSAANILIAVPGISTSTSANLVTNGTFETVVDGETGYDNGDGTVDGWNKNSIGSLSITNGTSGRALRVSQPSATAGVTYGQGSISLGTLTSGKRYLLKYSGLGGTAKKYPAICTNANTSNTDGSFLGLVEQIGAYSTAAEEVQKYFEPSSTAEHWLVLQLGNDGSGTYHDFDNIVVKQEDAPRDYSADIKGSGTNKTLTANGNAGVGYEIPSYYGSAMTFDGSSDSFQYAVPNSDALFLQNTKFTMECWVYPNTSFSDDRYMIALLSGNSSNSDGSYYLRIYDTYYQGIMVNSNNQYATTSANAYKSGQWTHVAYVRDGNEQRLYINGVCEAVTTHSILPNVNNSSILYIGSSYGLNNSINAQIQDVRIYDNVAKYKGGFDVPKPYDPDGIEEFRTVADTCKNNFVTWNPLDKTSGGTLSNGNLTFVGGAGHHGSSGSIPFKTGKWYCELRADDAPASNSYIGIMDTRSSGPAFSFENFYAYQYNSGNKYGGENGTYSETAYGSAASSGDIIGVAVDMDNKKIFFSLNGTWQNSSDPVAGTNQAFTIVTTQEEQYVLWSNTNAAHTRSANFGQNPSFCGQETAGTFTDGSGKGLFKYAVPSGFLALCEDNLPAPAIADPGDQFKCVFYEGNGSALSVNGVGFQPDFVWIKSRTSSHGHGVFDVIRGIERLDTTSTQEGRTNEGNIVISSDGFDITSSHPTINNSGSDMVAWCWKAGGAPVSNGDGSITTQVSANQTSGFSIVTGTMTSGTDTLGHGLGKAPRMIITKQTNGTTGWYTYVKDVGDDRTLRLDQDSASSSFSHWVTHPTTSVFSMGSGFGSGEEYVAYCFAEIDGFSKIGLYKGNNAADGTFVYCGFKPAWVLIKNADQNGTYWTLFDSSRKSTNPVNHTLNPDRDATEVTNGGNGQIDLVSNGFKCRNNDGGINGNNINYVYLAFAESPIKTANAK